MQVQDHIAESLQNSRKPYPCPKLCGAVQDVCICVFLELG